jgi:hypothetical protein
VETPTVVEDLDELEDRRPGRGTGREAVPVDQLTLDRGEEALGRGVVESRPHTAHRPRDPGLLQPAGERQGDVLRTLVGVVDQPGAGRLSEVAISRASTTSSERRWEAIDHPTIRLKQQSRMVARYSHPSPVGT